MKIRTFVCFVCGWIPRNWLNKYILNELINLMLIFESMAKLVQYIHLMER